MVGTAGPLQSPGSIRRWYLVHRWTSLVCTVFLLGLCLTGLPLIFHDEIDAALAHRVRAPKNGEGNRRLPLDRLVGIGKARYPREFLQFIFWEPEADLVGLGFAATADAPLEQVHRTLLNPYTGEIAGEQPADAGVTHFLLSLHRELLIGLPGTLLLGVMGLLFVAALVSGVVLYGPFIGRMKFGTVRTDRSPRLRWLDLHNLLGIATVAWMLVVGSTGVMNTLEEPLFGAWQARQLPSLLNQYGGKKPPARLASVNAAVAAARKALPATVPTSVGFPGSRFSTPHHYLVWMHGETRLTTHLFTPVLIDAATGQLTDARGLPWYLRVLEVSRPLHFGDYGGWPLKVIWALFDVAAIAVLGSGIYLWFDRRRSPVPSLKKLPAPEEEQS
jgi:uncharacterized iron-regulated membrane protein